MVSHKNAIGKFAIGKYIIGKNTIGLKLGLALALGLGVRSNLMVMDLWLKHHVFTYGIFLILFYPVIFCFWHFYLWRYDSKSLNFPIKFFLLKN